MAKTNWQDPKTSEIRSTHVSGLQEAVGKIEDSISMQTVAGTDIALSEVYISSGDRYRIYQAPEGKRNWVSTPIPVVKKNGSIIASGFEIDYGGGAIIFGSPILDTDTVTVDATYTVVSAIATSASDISYNKTASGLAAQNAQDAIDEVADIVSTKASFKNGSGTFPAGTTHTVTDAFITASTLVTISPTAEKKGVWSVDSANGSFTITSDTAETTGVTFDWGAVK